MRQGYTPHEQQILDLTRQIGELRLALETATRERDEARANISEVIEPEFFDKIMAAAVSEKELAEVRFERDQYKLRLSEVARDMAKSISFWQRRATENGKQFCECGPTHEGDSCIECRFRAVTRELGDALDRAVIAEQRLALLSRPAPPADAPTEADINDWCPNCKREDCECSTPAPAPSAHAMRRCEQPEVKK